MGVCYPIRVYKNEDITLTIPMDFETEPNEFYLHVYTDNNTYVDIPYSAITVEEGVGTVVIESGGLDPLNDGVIRYELAYSEGDNDYVENRNTNMVLKTPNGYSGRTCDEMWEDGYQSGYTDGQGSQCDCSEAYQSGITEGTRQQKAKLTTLTATSNMTYERTDGYNRVVVNVPTGYSQSDLDNAHTEGYNEGLAACSGDCEGVYESGYTEGFEDGYASGQTDCTGYTQQDIINAWNGGYLAGLNDCSGETPTPTPSGGTPDYSPRSGSTVNDYFTIEIIEGTGKIHFNNNTSFLATTVQYRKNGGSWQTLSSDSQQTALSSLDVVEGDKVEFRGDNASYEGNYFIVTNGVVAWCVRGNIMSLVDSTGFASATTLGDNAFKGTFEGKFPNTNENLYDAGDLLLPATNLGNRAYYQMFNQSTKLHYAPSVLPATDLSGAEEQYAFMFCSTMIEKAPDIKATTLGVKSCYIMFEACTNLEVSPILRPLHITTGAYYKMFDLCYALREVTCLATSMENGATGDWLNGVQTYGRFNKAAAMNDWTRDTSGIPVNWTVFDAS